MSWRERPRPVSVLAEMALRREKIAQRLADIRETRNMTQENAAAKVGVTLRQWQRWEAGESVPYPRNLDLIASAFGITVGEFFEEQQPPVVEHFAPVDIAAQLDRIETRLDEISRALAALSDGRTTGGTTLSGLGEVAETLGAAADDARRDAETPTPAARPTSGARPGGRGRRQA